jgi:hypothetical protein
MAEIFTDPKGRFCAPDSTTYLAPATPLTIDCSIQDEWAIPLVDRNITINFSNFTYGKVFILHLTCDATPRIVSWGAAVPSVFIAVTLTASKTTSFTFRPSWDRVSMLLNTTSFAY